MSNKQPRGTRPEWFKVYREDIADRRVDLGPALLGSWLLLMDRYWADGELPDDDHQLARIARLDVRTFRKYKG